MVLGWDCNPTVLAEWFDDRIVWFGLASINPTKQHVRQFFIFGRLHLDSGWKSELRSKVVWDRDTLPENRKIINKVQKKSFPDLKRTTNWFRMQPHQSMETHSDVLIWVKRALEVWGMDFARLIVVLTISLLPRQLQKEIVNKFTTLETRQDA